MNGAPEAEAVSEHPDIPPASFDLRGRVAIVTGGSQGVGWGIAAGLAHAGAAIVVVNRNVTVGMAAVAKLRAIGVEAVHVAADVGRAADIERSVAATLERFGRIDILVNCSGIVVRGQALDLPEAGWDRVMDVNLKGAWLFARAAARPMIAQGGGRIINVASLNAVRPGENKFAYAVSKAGMVQLTRALAREWAPHGITVNAIGPGMIASPRMVAHFAANPEERRQAMERIPLGRPGIQADLAGISVFLASAASAYITGEFFALDGGSALT